MTATWWRVLLAWDLALLVMLAISAPFIEPGTGTFVVWTISLALLLLTLVAIAIIVRSDWNPFQELESLHD